MATTFVDVLVVGAGPTGLALAAQLVSYGIEVRVVDRSHDRAHESRALAIQPRTLEVLAGLGVTERLVALGNPAVRLRLHVPHRVLEVPLFDLGMADTAYPYLLFLSQAETERVLGETLGITGIGVERGVELVDLRPEPDAVQATLREVDRGSGRAGAEERVTARYVVGCDGAHSTVRNLAGIGFAGGSYPQSFVLADVAARALEPGAVHAFLGDAGPLFFFPLGQPAPWRVLLMRPPDDATPSDAPITLADVQRLVDGWTGGTITLHDPVWMTNFRLHHRAASRYRAGRVFLAGDAAHIHSPAGAQGMNTGIQDAVNLGWKLAQAVRGIGDPSLLDTYEPERAPTGRMVVRFTDRLFRVGTSTNPVIRFTRGRLVPGIAPLALRLGTGRARVFRVMSQLGIRYRHSALSVEGSHPPRGGPKAGDRIPDGTIVQNGQMTTLHAALAAAGWHLLLCGPTDAWHTGSLGGAVTVHRLSARGLPGALHDPTGRTLRRLGLGPTDAAHYLMRPDGHIGHRAGGVALAGLDAYLRRWIGVAR